MRKTLDGPKLEAERNGHYDEKSVLLASVYVSTRRKRRIATNLAINLLMKINWAEQEYLDRMPLYRHGSDAHTSADYTVEALTTALVTLCDAFLAKHSEPFFRRSVSYKLDDTF